MTTRALRAIELHGRLGNQLFQFAALAAILDDDVCVPVEALRAGDWLRPTVRADAYRAITAAESLALGRPPVPPGRARRTVARLVEKSPEQGRSGPFGRHVYRELAEGAFDPGFAAAPAPVLYSGFFQNERYFRERQARIVEALLPPTVAAPAPEGTGATCAVVIRAGHDYVRLGWDLGYEWYERAARSVVATVPACRFVVFSDVPLAAEAAARALSHLGPAVAALGLSAHDQLHAIAACDHAVISSSSFAWWGAWLGDASRSFDPERIVIAPEPWISPGVDTVPERWTTAAVALDDGPEPRPTRALA